jgi:predicted nucleic acid-binding protein
MPADKPNKFVPKPLPDRFYTDTSFLVNLVQFSSPKKNLEGDKSPKAQRERYTRSKTYWDEYVARKEKRPTRVHAVLSPIVLQEFYLVCARRLLFLYRTSINKLKELEKQEERADKARPLPQISIKQAIELRELIVKSLAGREESTDSGADERVPGWFMKAVAPLIHERLKEFFSHLTLVPDVCSFPAEDFLSLLGTGNLSPADCVVALAAKNSGARAILTDDGDFVSASADLARIGLRIIHVSHP